MAKRNVKDRSAKESANTMDVKPEVNAVDAPATRFQDEQKVEPVAATVSNDVPDTSYVRQKTEAKGAKLKQAIAAEILTKGKGTGSSSDVIAPSAVGLKAMSFSGDSGSILGDVSGTPVLAKDIQGTTRIDKKNSDANKQLNYIGSEQYVTAYDNIPALAEDPESQVGYNGNPKLAAARSTKTSGMTPADLLYERSLDEIRQDKFVFVSGQVIKQDGVNYVDYPTQTCVEDDDGTWTRPTDGESNFSLKRGNYSPRALNVSFTNDGSGAYVSKFSFDVDDYSIDDADADVVNRAAANELTFTNAMELVRQRIDAEAGSPTMNGFCPLGRSVQQPTQTVALLHDMEAVMGATVGTAYRFANKSRGYFLNRAAKDGQDVTGPAYDALYGHLTSAVNLEQLTASLAGEENAPFKITAGCKAGSAFTLINVYDSITKYKTKADLVNQPRGLKLHIQTASANMKPFKYPNNFGKAMNYADVFSTIDRGYDPSAAVCITDNVRLVYPYDFSQMLGFTRESKTAARKYTSTLFAYDYKANAGFNSYVIKCGEPLLNGIAYLLETMAGSFYNALGGGKSGTVSITIPTVHSTCHFSLWDLLICAATPYILYERTNTLKDILDFESNHAYPFTDLEAVVDGAILNPTNYRLSDLTTPLVVQQMQPTSAITWTWPELFYQTGDNVIMPWYFSESSFSKVGTGDKMTLQDNGDRQFLTPVLRSGQRLDLVDDAQGMKPMDLFLSMDAMVTTPMGMLSFTGGVYKYSLASEGIPYIKASEFDSAYTYAQMHSIPRISGYVMNAYPGECCAYYNKTPEQNVFYALRDGTTTFYPRNSTSTRARAYYAYNVEKQSALLAKAATTLGRAQAFQQRWTEYRLDYFGTNNKGSDFDLGLSLADYLSGETTKMACTTNFTSFTPFTGSGNAVFGLHKYLWTRLAKLPYVLNPFDAGQSSMYIDPFDLAYTFNLAGFMSADYNEKEYNRRNLVQTLGYGFTNDPYIEESPIFH